MKAEDRAKRIISKYVRQIVSRRTIEQRTRKPENEDEKIRQ